MYSSSRHSMEFAKVRSLRDLLCDGQHGAHEQAEVCTLRRNLSRILLRAMQRLAPSVASSVRLSCSMERLQTWV